MSAKALLETLGMMAVHGSVLFAIALVLTRGRKLGPSWQAAVWFVVIVKFALPWAPALPWSLADLIASLRGDPVAAPIVVGEAGVLAPVQSSLPLGWIALAAVWAAGALFVIVRADLAERTALRAARRAPEAPAVARALLASLPGGARVRLVVGDAAVGPYVIGLLRPIIVVPPALVAAGAESLLRAALLHELAHVRRLDALQRLVQLIARAAFWWFPVVALASRRLDAAREAACDARALEVGQIERPAYARLLLEMAQLRTAGNIALAAPYALDRRIQSVLGPPRRSRLGLVHALGLVVWIGVALGGARSAEARGVETCVYNMSLAEALRQAHPEADRDQDGVLSHDEACEFQAELRRVSPEQTTALDETAVELLAEPLCCRPGDGLAPTTDAPSCAAE